MTNEQAAAARLRQLQALYGPVRNFPPEALQELFLLNEQAPACTAEACEAARNWCADC